VSDDNKKSDKDHQDDEEPDDDENLDASSSTHDDSSGATELQALNSFLTSDYFKGNAAFENLFKPGGTWAADIVAMFDRQVGTLPKIGEQMSQKILEQFGSIPLSAISKNLAAGAALDYAPYRVPSTKRVTAYSDDMNSPSDYFRPWERVIQSFADLQAAVTMILDHHPRTTFLWRGQQNAAWPLHSSLFRAVWRAKGVHSPDKTHRKSELFPTDQDLQRAESRILSAIREQWPFEDTSALSTFARLQHFGAPTRLLDVSRNPLIAAWFATEMSAETEVEEANARIFALATTRVADTQDQRDRDLKTSRINMDTAARFEPFWHVKDDAIGDTGFGEWGTGRIRRFWIPPHYESRIAAQNAAFILDGVPVDSPDLDKYYQKGNGRGGSWRLADRLAASSISVRFSRPRQGAGPKIAQTMPPSYTFRITAEAKREIRKELEDRYSYNKSTIYPDIQGAAQAIKDDPSIFENL
jgi:hypothetical protein